jgi:hypothetical protein
MSELLLEETFNISEENLKQKHWKSNRRNKNNIQ